MNASSLIPAFLTLHLGLAIVLLGQVAIASDTIPVADANLSAEFYADSSCLLSIDTLIQSGTTVIDADMDDQSSRMFIHCDTEQGRRLSLLARGDSLNAAQRVPLLTREEIHDGELGMMVWLTSTGVHYADDNAPRRFVVAGSVKLRKLPAVGEPGNALHAARKSFVSISGILEPLLKPDEPQQLIVIPTEADTNAKPDSDLPIRSLESTNNDSTESSTN